MKKLALILSIIVLAVMTTGIAFADDKKAEMIEVLTGEVVSVDVESGKIVIIANDEQNTLQAQPKMLEGIMAGQYVKIEKTGDEVKSIKTVQDEQTEPDESTE